MSMEGEKVELSRPSAPQRATDRRLTFYGQLETHRDRAILELHDRGWSVAEIAKAFRMRNVFIRGRLSPLLAMRMAGPANG